MSYFNNNNSTHDFHRVTKFRLKISWGIPSKRFFKSLNKWILSNLTHAYLRVTDNDFLPGGRFFEDREDIIHICRSPKISYRPSDTKSVF